MRTAAHLATTADSDASEAVGPPSATPQRVRVVSVLPDLSGLDRVFSYTVPELLAGEARIGALVRVPLGRRRVRGWVVACEEDGESAGLRDLEAVVSLGPSPEVVALARFAAWRYAGPLRPFLAAGSPERLVARAAEPAHGPDRLEVSARPTSVLDEAVGTLTREAIREQNSVLALPPLAARLPVVLAALSALSEGSDLLVLVPARRDATLLASRLAALGVEVAPYPSGFAEAVAGGRVVVGTRRAAFASLRRLGGVVVLDAHDEAYVEERAPTWNANVIAAERARRAGVPVLFASAVPSLELTAAARQFRLPTALERSAWPAVEVLDRRGDDPRAGLYAPGLAEMIRAARRAEPERPVVCVLNRTGRARLLACAACGDLVTCEACDGPLAETRAATGAARTLVCARCGLERPRVCARCDSARLKALRVGVTRVAEELEALVGIPVSEVSGASAEPPEATPLVVGTEAVLHRLRRASLVVFLDFDQELLAPRLRAGEQALGLIARAGRLLGARSADASGFTRRVVVQTRLVDHAVLAAARAGDPSVLSLAEAARRRALGLPPYAALALLTGPGASALSERLGAVAERAELAPGRYLVRAPDEAALADALAASRLPDDDVRVEVDPLRL